jgi:hypothetical protein
MQRRPLIGRKILCCGCNHLTVKGVSRVMRKVLFFFCPECWEDRRACEIQMDKVSAPE